MNADECSISMQCNKFNFDHRTNAVRYKPTKNQEEQKDRCNAVEQSNNISKTSWRKYHGLTDEDSAYRDKLISILTQFEII